MFRRCGGYVGRILGGTKASDLPIQRPARFDLVVNLKTAKSLGITIPETILRACRCSDRIVTQFDRGA